MIVIRKGHSVHSVIWYTNIALGLPRYSNECFSSMDNAIVNLDSAEDNVTNAWLGSLEILKWNAGVITSRVKSHTLLFYLYRV